jgi:hypothetical protein
MAQFYGPPCFVAVEAPSEDMGEIGSQRAKFRCVAKGWWSFMPVDLRHELSCGIAFEADTHLTVFPDVPIIRLDDGRMTVSDPNSRQPMALAAQDLAASKLRKFKDWLEDVELGLRPDVSRCLKELSYRAVLTGIEERDDPARAVKLSLKEKWSGEDAEICRDTMWARRINAKWGQLDCDWALVVVGARHCDETPGSLRALLQDDGRSVEVYWFAA